MSRETRSSTESTFPSTAAELAARPPKIIAGVNIHRGYTPEEVFELHDKGLLRPITLEGYATRVDEGKIWFVPWTESTAFRAEHGKLMQHDISPIFDKMAKDLEEEHPMFRRTPQERTTSMVMRLMATVKQTGGLPGISDADIKALVGNSWKDGSPITEDVVRALVAKLLNVAQNQNRAADAKRSTRAHPYA